MEILDRGTKIVNHSHSLKGLITPIKISEIISKVSSNLILNPLESQEVFRYSFCDLLFSRFQFFLDYILTDVLVLGGRLYVSNVLRGLKAFRVS